MKRATNFILIDHMPFALDCSEEEGLRRWVQWMEDHRSERIVAEDKIDPYWISTVFLGLDQQFSPGPPLLFETMIFERNESTCLLIDGNIQLIDHVHSDLDHLRWRYSTWEEAEQGHRNVAAMVKRALLGGTQWWKAVARIVKNKPVCR